jgi:hypothetical protein
MIKVADECWVATALLHREHPERPSFRVTEIVDRAAREGIAGSLRPGVLQHAQQHCVANKRPNPGTYRMLYAPAQGGRRLFRTGDDYHPYREGGKITPLLKDLPLAYQPLLRWYVEEWDAQRNGVAGTAPKAAAPAPSAGTTSRVALISCASLKADRPLPARDFYVSPLFQKSRAWAETNCDQWYVLSAEHGLVHPETVIAPYERTLKTFPAKERAAWARRVHQQMDAAGLLTPECGFVWLAGAAYRNELSQLLRGFVQEVPLRGLKIGQQIQWLIQQLKGAH